MEDTVCTFSKLKLEQYTSAGGKGRTLAFLFQKRFPVPDGFIILSTGFTQDELLPEVWTLVQTQLEHLRKTYPHVAFAVRSSAVAEDSALTSFAGEFESILNVKSDEEIHTAINTVRSSRNSERIKAYSQAQGVEAVHEMAVVVQRMIQPGISGVLFTADPVTGNRNIMVGNYVHGLGDKLVSGETGAAEFTIQRYKYRYEGSSELEQYHHKLYKLAKKLEKELGCPQDIEWAISDNKLHLLQSRPISTMNGFNPVTGEYNDTLTGDFVWTCVNTGEAIPDVMTPYTWSCAPICWNDINIVPGYELVGNIGGRCYQNSTVMLTMYKLLRQDVMSLAREAGGLREENAYIIERYLVPLEGISILPVVPRIIRLLYKTLESLKGMDTFVANNPGWCRNNYQKIKAMQNKELLHLFMIRKYMPHVLEAFWKMYATFLHLSLITGKLRNKLTNMVGAEDTDILLSNVSTDDDMLSSLGPLVGLSEVVRGEKSREEYLEQWGHRGPFEAEAAVPRPLEDPAWLDKQIETFRQSGVDVRDMLSGQRARFDSAWNRLVERYPRKAKKLRKRLGKVAKANRIREAARSEFIRLSWISRTWALRAGELTGIGDDVFFLSYEEILGMLNGFDITTAYIPARRRMYEKYKALPPYPLVVSGRFDPFQWAADPDRSTYLYDSHKQNIDELLKSPSENVILGTPGSAGKVEGTVRRLDTPDDWNKLRQGEILVTSTTNIGWTLIFPKLSGIVTDVGAALSHAAIVARELGIPAVVNCGDATMRLHTGDRVRVDGTQGTVEIL